jgi:hypothetical protein
MTAKMLYRRGLLLEVLAAALLMFAIERGVVGRFGLDSPQNPTLSVATNGLHLAYIGKPYLAVMTATGGTPPYLWSVTPGTLPPGISLHTTSGQIEGTPEQGGQFSAVITVTDLRRASASKTFSLQVFEQPTDKYGGLVNKACPDGPHEHFYVQEIKLRWYLCTPAGNAFWINGVSDTALDDGTDYQGINYYNLVNAKYSEGLTSSGTLNWALSANRRLQSWGFNTHVEAGYWYLLPTATDNQWRTRDDTIPIHLPFIGLIMPTRYSSFNLNNYAPGPTKNSLGSYKLSVFKGWVAGAADVFDANFAAWLKGELAHDPIVRNWYSGPNHDYLIGLSGDESDDTGGFRAGSDFQTVNNGTYQGGHADPHWGWITLITTPVKAATARGNTPASRAPSDIVYADTRFYSKTELSNWLQQTADNGPGYTSIAALNAAWGSNYDSFGSDAITHTGEACATANGTVGPYTCTLARTPVTPLTVQVFANGKLMLGDDAAGPLSNPPTGSGNFRQNGRTSPQGSITYTTGAISITFATAITPGTPITVSYKTGGWGSGHGLLDEDGTCPARYTSHCWVPTDAYLLAGATPAMKADLDSFLYHYAKKYGSLEKAEISAVAPGVLYLGPGLLGSWGTPSQAPVLRAFGEYVDLMYMPTVPTTNPLGKITNDQERIDYIARYAGDKPWFNWQGFWAQADSYMSVYKDHDAMFNTQTARAQYYQTWMNSLLAAKVSSKCNCASAGISPIVGMAWWQYTDMRNERANWGLVTPRDDPYDGVSATTSEGYDSWGYPTGCLAAFGCERANYGDFLDYVTNANLNALRALLH